MEPGGRVGRSSPWTGRSGGQAGSEWALAAVVAAVALGPALRPGYLLRYDLVSVPRPVLGVDALGLGDRLPRAVPWDAVVAVAARLLPDRLLVQFAALAALTLAGAGAARLARRAGPGRWAALLVSIWNPFVLEELAIGHVPHLLGYGAVPWVGLGAAKVLAGRRDAWPASAAACLVGSVTPGGGLLCLGTTLAVCLAHRTGWRRVAVVVGTAAAAQAPWVTAALLHPGTTTTVASEAAGAAAATVFATRAETGFGVVFDVLGLGGLWAPGPLPTSRTTWLAAASTVLLVGLAVAGLRPAVRANRRDLVVAAAALVTSGYLVALLPHLPGGRRALALLVSYVPGAGLLRDGHRWLAWPAIGLAVLVGFGVGSLGRSAANRSGNRWMAAPVVVAASAAVVAVAPDLALGLAGRLRPVAYPGDWARARAVLESTADTDRILVLPWQPFRRFPWSGPAPVLDPAPRALPRPTLVDDALTVGGVRLAAEGSGSRAVWAALGDDVLTAEELARLGVGWILVERRTPGTLPAVPAPPAATVVLDGPDLRLLRLTQPEPVDVDPISTTVVTAGHLGFGALLAAAAFGHLGAVLRRKGYLRP